MWPKVYFLHHAFQGPTPMLSGSDQHGFARKTKKTYGDSSLHALGSVNKKRRKCNKKKWLIAEWVKNQSQGGTFVTNFSPCSGRSLRVLLEPPYWLMKKGSTELEHLGVAFNRIWHTWNHLPYFGQPHPHLKYVELCWNMLKHVELQAVQLTHPNMLRSRYALRFLLNVPFKGFPTDFQGISNGFPGDFRWSLPDFSKHLQRLGTLQHPGGIWDHHPVVLGAKQIAAAKQSQIPIAWLINRGVCLKPFNNS